MINFAFSALMIYILALPGLIFQRAFTRGALEVFTGHPKPFPKHYPRHPPTSSRTIGEQILTSLISATVLHSIAIAIWHLFEHDIPFDQMIRLMVDGGGGSRGKHGQEVADYVIQNVSRLTLYCLTLFAFAGFAGRFCLWMVRRTQFDFFFHVLRFNDPWFYFLRGEIFSFREFDKQSKSIWRCVGRGLTNLLLFWRECDPVPNFDAAYIKLVIEHDSKDYVYGGVLVDFYLDSSNQLDRLLLEKVARIPLNPSEDNADNFECMQGELMSIRYSDCKRISVSFPDLAP